MGIKALQEIMKTNEDWRNVFKNDFNLIINEDENYILIYYTNSTPREYELLHWTRGVIFAKADYSIVAAPFKRFFNYGEQYASKLYGKLKFFEKIDGSLIKMWFHNDEWHISTQKNIDAGNALVDLSIFSFKDLFMDGLKAQGFSFDRLDKGVTYLFELVSPYNQVVVAHERCQVYHLASRENSSLKEIEVDIGIQKPREYGFLNIEEACEFAEEFDDLSIEGFVVVDELYNRVKLKTKKYMRAHYMRTNNKSLKSFLNIIVEGEASEFGAYFPKEGEILQLLEKTIRQLEDTVWFKTNYYQSVSNGKKDFVQKIQKEDGYIKSLMLICYGKFRLNLKERARHKGVDYLIKLLTLFAPDLKEKMKEILLCLYD